MKGTIRVYCLENLRVSDEFEAKCRGGCNSKDSGFFLNSLTIEDEPITFFRNAGNRQPRYSAYNPQKTCN